MVKKLSDLCLGCIQNKLCYFQQAIKQLPTTYKETLLERLAWHDLLCAEKLIYVTYNLFVPALKRINFYKCPQIQDNLLKTLSECGCRLEWLKLHGCENVTDVGVQAITDSQSELIILELRKLPKLTSKGLCRISSTKLEKLDLRGSINITTDGIKSVLHANPSIKCLVLAGLKDLSLVVSNVFQDIAMCLGPNLEDLDTGSIVMTDEAIESIANNCLNLKRLNLHGCSRISGDGLLKLCQGCPHLQSLDLSYCHKLKNVPDCEALWTLPMNLTELSLCGILLEDEDILIESMQRLRRLKQVRLSGISALTDKTLDEILKHIGAQLTHLDISGSVTDKISDDSLQAVAKYCVNLEELLLQLLRQVTCLPLISIFQERTRACKFKKLFLSCKKMEYDVLSVLSRTCHNLQDLDLSGLYCVDDSLLVSLSENCHMIKSISLKGCKQITDVGICALASRERFKVMVLSGVNNLTDRSIFALANSCHYLDELYLNGCYNISPVAITYLTDCCIPRVYIKHVTPNIIPDKLMAKNLDTGEFCRVDDMCSHTR